MNTFILFVLLFAVKEKKRKQTIAYSLSAAFIILRAVVSPPDAFVA